jgi:hypothetical protein
MVWEIPNVVHYKRALLTLISGFCLLSSTFFALRAGRLLFENMVAHSQRLRDGKRKAEDVSPPFSIITFSLGDGEEQWHLKNARDTTKNDDSRFGVYGSGELV